MKLSKFFLTLVLMIMATTLVHTQVPVAGDFREEGIASWYGPGFDGRQTASGEIFDSNQFTAAHPSLPFGTIVTVTNTFNNRQVNVRINDRGPFVPVRIIDLSRAAAEILDMINTGTASVIVESAINAGVGPQTASGGMIMVPSLSELSLHTGLTSAEESPRAVVMMGDMPQLGTGKHYRIQVGAYRIPRNAVDTFERLRNVGLNPAYERLEDLYRVVLAGLKPEEIQGISETLYALGFREVIIREEH